MPPRRNREGSKKNAPLELPGFYYDSEKKRYYRILPQHKCAHPLASKKNVQLNPKFDVVSKPMPSFALPHLKGQLQQGNVAPEMYSTNITDLRLKNLKLVHEVVDSLEDRVSAEKDCCLFLIPWPEQNCLIGVCNDGEKGRCKVRAWLISSNSTWSENENPNCKISVKPYVEPLWYVSGKITEVCLGHLLEDNPCLFICSVQTRSRAVTHLVVLPLKTIFQQQYGDLPFRVEVFKFERNTVWSCCSSQQERRIIAGMESQLIAFSYQGVITNSIPVPGQNVFGVSCDTTGRIIYATTSKGDFNGYDVRANCNKSPTLTVPLGVPAYQLEPMTNQDMILISGYQNYLNTFDLRMQKVVLTYPHHDNEYTRIKASLDENENVLSSAGQNGAVRLWNVNNGKLLNVLPVPESYDKADFASTWFRGETCLPAQVTLTGKKMHIYQSF